MDSTDDDNSDTHANKFNVYNFRHTYVLIY